ncbi:hypothetical protein AURDEDRAFT_164596 [Auricularia subglabra TFB-10046 SS5]|nr:hypothetical protein AURDEDRAFT_164596 [Auricularia subglabra TFB-10046 SS5]
MATVPPQLPFDIFHMVIDLGDMEQLLLVSRVCRRWRAAARSHAMFWRRVYLGRVSTSSIAFFQARLGATTDTGVSLRINIPKGPLCSRMRDEVLPAISRNLHRLARLDVNLHIEVSTPLFHVLSKPAPLLEHLCIQLYRYDCHIAVIPPDLLGGSCQALSEVVMTDVALPTEAVHAFQAVQSLTVGSTMPHIVHDQVLLHFPALKHLTVSNQTTQPGLLMMPHDISRNETCDRIFRSVENIVAILGRTTSQPRDVTARFLLTHMRGPLELALLCPTPACIHLSIAASSPARSRTMVLLPPQLRFGEGWPPLDALFVREPALRITTLRIAGRLTYLASLFKEMPACETVEIIIDRDTFPPPVPLPLPALKTVVLRYSHGRTSVSAEALDIFLLNLLGPRVTPLALRLDGICVFGESRFL